MSYVVVHEFSLGPSRPSVAVGTTLVVGVDVTQGEANAYLASGQIRGPSFTATATTIAKAARGLPGYDEATLVPVLVKKGRSLGPVNTVGPTRTDTESGGDVTPGEISPGTLTEVPPAVASEWAKDGSVLAYPYSNLVVDNGNNGVCTAYAYVWVVLAAGSDRAHLATQNGISLGYYGISSPGSISGNGIASNTTVLSTGIDDGGFYLQMSWRATAPILTNALITGSVSGSFPTGSELNIVFTPNNGFEIDQIQAGYISMEFVDNVDDNITTDIGTGAATLTISPLTTPDNDEYGNTYFIQSAYKVES